jgi:hypothetical protein
MRRHTFRRPHDYRSRRRVDGRFVPGRATWGRLRYVTNATSDSYTISATGDLRGDCQYGEAYVIFWASTESPTEAVDKVVITTDAPGTLTFAASTPHTLLNGAVQTTSPPAGLWAAIANGDTPVTVTCSPQTALGVAVNTSWVWGILRVAKASSLWPIYQLPYAEAIFAGPVEDRSDFQVGDVFDCSSTPLQYNAASLLFMAGSAPAGGSPCRSTNGTYDNWQMGFHGAGFGNGFCFAYQYVDTSSATALRTAQFTTFNSMVEGSGVYLSLFPAIPVEQQAAGALYGQSSSLYDVVPRTDHGRTRLLPYEN